MLDGGGWNGSGEVRGKASYFGRRCENRRTVEVITEGRTEVPDAVGAVLGVVVMFVMMTMVMVKFGDGGRIGILVVARSTELILVFVIARKIVVM